MKTLLIVDDHPIVRSGLRRLLAAEPQFDIAEAANGQEAISLFRQLQPDLVILDLDLPDIGGLEVLTRLRTENAKARILVISMHDNPVYVSRVLQAGARGYVGKTARPEQILDAVRRVAAGRNYIAHDIAQELALWSLRAAPNPLQELPPRDIEILRLLAEGRSLVEIARAIGISYKTVANRCTQLKVKLATPRTADLIRVAISSGLSRGDLRLGNGALPDDGGGRAPRDA
jgi:two-component system invasion response regulator UvrY